MKSSNFELFAVAYDEASLGLVKQSGFSVLENMDNPRPDWFEYWPIRRYLTEQELRNDTWYGFFSPRFQEKTGLNSVGVRQVIANLEAIRPGLDIVLFSPQPDMGAFFLNVFEQGEMFHPGQMAVAKDVLAALGFDAPIDTMVMDSRQIVFSNYFVAKPRFWRSWFKITEATFNMAEDASHPLYGALNAGTSYRDGSHQKVFLVERIASLLLTLQLDWRAASADTFSFAWSSFQSFNAKREWAYQSDALKMAFRETGHMHYIYAFETIRKSIGRH